MEFSDSQWLGMGLGAFGVFFLLLGMLLFFDTGLLAIGNLFCIAGKALIYFNRAELRISKPVIIRRSHPRYWSCQIYTIFCST